MKNHALILLISSLALHASQFSTFGKAVWKEVESAPFATTSKHRFEKHQYASTRFSLGNDGKVTAITTFENGKKLDGDHFYCRIELFDAATNRIAVTRQEAGLNAAGLGSPKKKTKRSVMKLRADKSTNIKFVRFTYGHFNKVDDNKFWDNVKKTALVVGEIAYAIESGDFAVLMEDYADNQAVDGSAAEERAKTQLKDKLPKTESTKRDRKRTS